MNPPIISVFGKGNIHVYPSLAVAESDMEMADVENGDYDETYDSEGRLLKCEINSTPSFFGVRDGVRLSVLSDATIHQFDLRLELIAFLLHREETSHFGESLFAMTLAELVKATAQAYGINSEVTNTS